MLATNIQMGYCISCPVFYKLKTDYSLQSIRILLRLKQGCSDVVFLVILLIQRWSRQATKRVVLLFFFHFHIFSIVLVFCSFYYFKDKLGKRQNSSCYNCSSFVFFNCRRLFDVFIISKIGLGGVKT